MGSLEAWLEFRRNERYDDPTTCCYHCGEKCSGDVTETIEDTAAHLGTHWSCLECLGLFELVASKLSRVNS